LRRISRTRSCFYTRRVTLKLAYLRYLKQATVYLVVVKRKALTKKQIIIIAILQRACSDWFRAAVFTAFLAFWIEKIHLQSSAATVFHDWLFIANLWPRRDNGRGWLAHSHVRSFNMLTLSSAVEPSALRIFFAPRIFYFGNFFHKISVTFA